MDIYVLESFISFCDDMMIAEEGSKLSSVIETVWINIRTIFKKILQFFKNILTNINYFKTAQLPSQKSKDIIAVVQNLSPRYEILNKMFMIIYRTSSIGQKNGGDSDYYYIMLNDIEQSLDDVTEVISTAKDSPEYKRIEENSYDEKTNIEVPLSNIVTAIKKSQSDLIKYDSDAQKMQVMETNAKSEAAKKATGKCRRLFTTLCEIYNLKIKLLKIFFTSASASIKAIGKNVKEKEDKNFNPNRSYSSEKNFLTMLIKHGASRKKVKLTPEQEKQFQELDKIIVNSKNDLYKYDEYYKAYSELCKLVGVGTNVVLIYGIPGKTNQMIPDGPNGEKTFMVTKEDPKPMKVLSNTQLFHTSSDENLKELTGRFFHSSLGVRRLWNTPRVYFSIGNAMAKDGSKYIGSDPMAIHEGEAPRALYKYTPVNHISTVHRDVEMGLGSAVYVESKTPIKLKKLS